jgi:hypothetical protein
MEAGVSEMTNEELKNVLLMHVKWLSRDYGKMADLSGANLRWADLSGADLPIGVSIMSISGVGSSRRMTTYRSDTDEIWCGCFKGTLSEFAEQVEKTHKDNPKHLSEYRAVATMFRAMQAKKGGGGGE